MMQQPYYQGPSVAPIVQSRRRTVNDLIPTSVPALLGVAELFLWIAIVALETVSVYYDTGRGTVYAGFWCSIVFFATWIAMFCYLCCGKSAGCGTYLVIQNVINLIFAIILLIFTARFVQNPCLCYGALCFVPNWDDIYDGNIYDNNYYQYSCTSRTLRKIPILKGLLACAVLMVACNVIFIAVYLILSIRFRNKIQSNNQSLNVGYQQQSAAIHMGGQTPYHPSTVAYSPHHQQQSYPTQHPQAPPQWSSAPPSYEIRSDKF